MSYILDALKKAQAERQLGQLPTLHAAPLQQDAPAAGAAAYRPGWLLAGGAALALALGALYALLWREPAPYAASAPAAPAPPLAAAPQFVPAPAAAGSAAPPLSAMSTAGTVPAPMPAAAPAPATVRPAPPLPAPAKVAARPLRTAEPVPAPDADAAIPGVRQLPEAIQGQLPTLALGGYIYSSNPADRLLIIDKALRHEGEELAPGLTLEKLLPKAAVFNYKGYRYRVPY